jgi:hypothetical protein
VCVFSSETRRRSVAKAFFGRRSAVVIPSQILYFVDADVLDARLGEERRDRANPPVRLIVFRSAGRSRIPFR